MTSWLVRASLNQACDPLTLTQYYWPQHRLWTYDVDRGFNYIDNSIYRDIAILARTDPVGIQQVNLVVFADILGVKPKTSAASIPWTQPLSKRNRTAQIGYPYCPVCLEADRQAYLKLPWRYTWVMYCQQHQLKLQNHCVYCQQPYQPQLLKASARYLNRCHYCEEKLAIATGSGHIQPLAYSFQQCAEQIWHLRQGKVLGQQVSANEWFALVLFYTRLLRRAIKRPNHMFGQILAYLGIKLDKDILETAITGLALDLLPIDDRIELFARVYQLLDISIEQWLDACREYEVSQNSFKWSKDFLLPSAFMPVFLRLPQRTKYSRRTQAQVMKPTSPEVVKQAWARLQRKMQMREFYDQNRSGKAPYSL